MTEEMDNVLRRSLDEVDRTRRRQWIYLALSFACLSVFLISIIGTAESVGDFSRGGSDSFGSLEYFGHFGS